MRGHRSDFDKMLTDGYKASQEEKTPSEILEIKRRSITPMELKDHHIIELMEEFKDQAILEKDNIQAVEEILFKCFHGEKIVEWERWNENGWMYSENLIFWYYEKKYAHDKKQLL